MISIPPLFSASCIPVATLQESGHCGRATADFQQFRPRKQLAVMWITFPPISSRRRNDAQNCLVFKSIRTNSNLRRTTSMRLLAPAEQLTAVNPGCTGNIGGNCARLQRRCAHGPSVAYASVPSLREMNEASAPARSAERRQPATSAYTERN